MPQKKLDLNQNGVVDDNEIAAAEALDRHEKAGAQKRMAWIAMASMIGFTIAVFLPIFPDSRIKALADLFGLFPIRLCLGQIDFGKVFGQFCFYFSIGLGRRFLVFRKKSSDHIPYNRKKFRNKSCYHDYLLVLIYAVIPMYAPTTPACPI